MKSYKVEITKTYVYDIRAEDTKQAEDLAETRLDADMLSGTEHYAQTGDTDFMTYDVTGTDDDFTLNQD